MSAERLHGYVAGATGFVGRALVEDLCRNGWRVTAHVRPDSKQLEAFRAEFLGLGAQVDATPWEPEAMASALAQLSPSHVFCCIGTTRKRMARDGADTNSYQAIDFGLTALLARACGQAGGVQRLVYLSSMGASPTARSAYLAWRWKAECAVRACAVPFTIARPGIISGARRESRPAEHAAALVADGVLAIAAALGAKALRERYRSTDDRALAAALRRVATDPAAEGQTLEADQVR
ncbi:MAG: NAD(P)H-binding protein [Deltaproteobacteria bacterium]|nr:NAD(P)H-binding protein [Deltaproteobacteria bacterium]